MIAPIGVLTVGFARVYAGAQFITDVIAANIWQRWSVCEQLWQYQAGTSRKLINDEQIITIVCKIMLSSMEARRTFADTSQKPRAINGYGNLGRAVELAVNNSDDMELVAIFTRRDPESLDTQFAPAVSIDEAPDYVDQVDVCVLCGGSATDLVEQGPEFVKLFNTVDSYDNHSKIPEYFASIDRAAKASGHVGVISAGWDPGLFSLNRLIGEAVLPNGSTTTFWGPGVSQGHSQAVRNIEGVVDAVRHLSLRRRRARIRSGRNLS